MGRAPGLPSRKPLLPQLQALAGSAFARRSETIAAENRERTNGATFAHPISERLAYPIPELARKLSVNRKTIERRIADGTFKTVNMLGHRLVTTESVKALFEPQD